VLAMTCTGTVRGRTITSVFRSPLFKISVCRRLWLRVNDGRCRLFDGLLRRNIRSSRFRFYFQRAPEVRDFFLHQQTVAALRQTFQIKRPKPDAFQFFHRMPFREKHAAQNIFLGILQRYLVPEIFRMTPRRVRLTHRADSPAGVASQPFKAAYQQPALNFHVIHLLKICPVLQHFCRKIPIVGQKNQAHRVVVEPPNGIHALGQTFQAIHQRLAAFRISHGGHDFRRLIEDDVNASLVGFHRPAGGFDAVYVSIRL
jgi:hypothetical protein